MSSLEKVGIATQADIDAVETQEWLEALEAVLEQEGPERAHFLLERLVDLARRSGAHIPFSPNTAYVNTIPPGLEPGHPGNLELEARIRSYVRWIAMSASRRSRSPIASAAMAATLADTLRHLPRWRP